MAEKHRKARHEFRTKLDTDTLVLMKKVAQVRGAPLATLARWYLRDGAERDWHVLVVGGLAREEKANPQKRTRNEGRVLVPLILAGLLAGSASQGRTDSNVSTFVRPLTAYSVDPRKRKQEAA